MRAPEMPLPQSGALAGGTLTTDVNPPPGSGCAHCGADICDHPDLIFAGIVVIDDRSDAGSWERHLRHTGYMRGEGA